MECPNCNTKITKSNRCPVCSTDISIYNRVKLISVKLYNKGLEQAKNRDLTGAIENLIKSIEFDKGNILARNVLGLAYFEVGQIGEALKQWIISSSLQKEDNRARGYIEALQNSGRNWERLNDAVKMYNHALVYLGQKSEDMAIIQLKKAIEINPRFVDAMNLLALCHMMERANEKAVSQIEKVLKIDVNNPKAISYYLRLRPNSSRVKPDNGGSIKKQESPVRREYARHPGINDRRRRGVFPITEIISFLVGAGCVAAILTILIFPDRIAAKDEEILKITEEAQAEIDVHLQEVAKRDVEIEDLKKENVNLQKVNDDLKVEQKRQAKVQELQQIQILQENGEVTLAAEAIWAFDITDLPDEHLEGYDSIKRTAYEKAFSEYYDSAIRKWNAREYEEARPLLEFCEKYGSPENNNLGNSLYYLGYIAEMIDEDEVLAKTYYERVISEFPTCKQYNNAKNRNNRLT